MSNNSETVDFIVKAKDIDVDISNTLKKSLSYSDTRNIYIFLFILYLFFIIQLRNNTIQVLILMTIFYFVLTALIIKIISFEVKWDLKIHNKKIYVYYNLRHHYIDYYDLVNFEIEKVHKRVTRYGSVQINALVIYYLKKGKLHRIELEVKDYIKPEIEKVCKAFITKKQLDNNPNNYHDYIYISKENSNEKINAIKRYTKNNLKSFYIVSIAMLILMSLTMLHLIVTLLINLK